MVRVHLTMYLIDELRFLLFMCSSALCIVIYGAIKNYVVQIYATCVRLDIISHRNLYLYGITVESRNYAPLLCMLALGKTGEGLIRGIVMFTCDDHYRPTNATWARDG